MTNLVLLTIDCFRYDRCGFNGHNRPTTPTLDSLAAESIVFDHAYATGPYTTESFPGIIAGQHSFNGAYYGADYAWKALEPDSETIATFLQARGYETVATLSNPHLTRSRNFNRGFDSFRNLRTTGDDRADPDDEDNGGWGLGATLPNIRGLMESHSSLVNPYIIPYLGYRYYQLQTEWPSINARSVLDAFVDNLRDTDAPFFGWTHLMDLHAPLHPNTVQQGGLAANDTFLRQSLFDAARIFELHEPRYDTMYDSALRYVDDLIGEFISFLKDADIWDETALIITGDHGEVLFDRAGIYGHPRHHLFDESLRVPLLIRLPAASHDRIDSVFSLAWIHELISEIVGAEPGTFPAQSEVEWLSGQEPSEPPVVTSDALDGAGHSVAIRDADTKTIHHRAADGVADVDHDYLDQPVQFAYRSDPGERVPSQDVGTDFRDLAETRLRSPNELPSIGEGISTETSKQLQDLGYQM
ncbi:sulfatase-like hydrolase/transferase [Halorubrum salinarum]|uniref:Sulfatase-like hydrolase/transferase n=1 Tax=Halorubrum salinarum TaxID=2739057 RepID=A0A7D4CJK4_9EURY|nr:sulfatase [Halorubrum salinarum]QKG92041.1 sulfatase-like hydrolase/transferase [Halorubrum salinarum]